MPWPGDGFPRLAGRGRGVTRTILGVPLLLEGRAVGALVVRRGVVRAFTAKEIALLKTFADQAAIAIDNTRMAEALRARNADLTEALGRERATAEILGVISGSQADPQPVFEAIARTATRLCGADYGSVFRFDGERLHVAAMEGLSPAGRDALAGIYPRPLDRGTLAGEALLDGTVVHVSDFETDPRVTPVHRRVAATRGTRALVAAPMLLRGERVGVVTVSRRPPGPFSDQQIALLRTFADQAVVAIDNARLFGELQAKNAELTEALEQQTATAEVLRVISGWPTEIEPVLRALVESAARLCRAYDATIFRLEGDTLRVAAHHGPIALPPGHAVPVVRGTVGGRSVIDRRPVQVTDVQAEADEYPEGAVFARELGFRAILSVPLLRETVPMGAIHLRRTEARPFTDRQIALLQTFADQAVVAIENVRLFTELEARNRALTPALEQQTATGEILRVISSSPTDTQPVFESIVRSQTFADQAVIASSPTCPTSCGRRSVASTVSARRRSSPTSARSTRPASTCSS